MLNHSCIFFQDNVNYFCKILYAIFIIYLYFAFLGFCLYVWIQWTKLTAELIKPKNVRQLYWPHGRFMAGWSLKYVARKKCRNFILFENKTTRKIAKIWMIKNYIQLWKMIKIIFAKYIFHMELNWKELLMFFYILSWIYFISNVGEFKPNIWLKNSLVWRILLAQILNLDNERYCQHWLLINMYLPIDKKI